MSEFRARIGRIRMKNGGADVRVLDRDPVNPNDEDWRGKIVANARGIAESGELAGYLVIGMFADGSYSMGFRYDHERTPIPLSLIPSWTEEIIRRELITKHEARSVFNDMFYRVDGSG